MPSSTIRAQPLTSRTKSKSQSETPTKPTGDVAQSPLLSQSKDVRAYEHERQRSKDATAYEHSKRVKKSVVALPKTKTKTRSSWTATLGLAGREVDDVDSLDGVLLTPPMEVSEMSLSERVHYTPEVKLAELVTTKKPRKGKAGDFEVIPHVRHVIVLDDFTGHDLSIEEPWECIEGESDEDSHSDASSSKAPSYAAVLAK